MKYHRSPTVLGNRPSGYVIPDPDKLPRYRFQQNGTGCAEHGNPYCLCDVNMPTIPTEVDCDKITFGALALQAVGGKLVAQNFVEFASLVFGMHAAEKLLDPEKGTGGKPSHTGDGTAWTELDDTVRAKMRAAWKEHVPWSQAKTFLPETVDPAGMRYLSKYYNQRLYAKRAGSTTTKETTT